MNMINKAIPEMVVNMSKPRLDVQKVRAAFPIFSTTDESQPVAFLDTAASAQKPQPVIDAMVGLMGGYYANIHRGVYGFSQTTTVAYENARQRVARFINAAREEEIIFTRNATEGINLVAASWARTHLERGDEVVLTELEHHANIVPWQLLRDQIGIGLRIVPVDDTGAVDMAEMRRAIRLPRTRLVSVSAMSNSLGVRLPVQEICTLAKEAGVPTLIDATQAVVHGPVDVQNLDCDFLVFTGHKLYGPTGVGVLYGKFDRLSDMPPYQGGGDMIQHVSFERTTYQDPPSRFEAGTPAIAQAVGLAAAIEYIESLGWDEISAHEMDLLAYATQKLSNIPGLFIYGTAEPKGGIVSFVLEGAHPHDVGAILDKKGVAVRTGHHCTHPLMDKLGVSGTTRASFGVYTTHEDIDRLVDGLDLVRDLLG